MKKYSVRKYEAADFQLWNAFVDKSKNGTFLFNRNFMDYHADRFEDFSLMIFNDGKLMGLLPANRVDSTIHSHQGLTYGGLVLDFSTGVDSVREIFETMILFLKDSGFTIANFKMMPAFYAKAPSQELDFLLARKSATLIKREMDLAIDFSKPYTISANKRNRFRKVAGLGMEIKKEQQFGAFWDHVLVPRLKERYDSAPVHTVQEIVMLCSRFPENIYQYNAYLENRIIAGITIFDFTSGVKCQYMATTSEGEKLRALDFLTISLIDEFATKGCRFFDMGTVTENNEFGYNIGLLKQKEEFGCSVYNQDYYSLAL